MKKTILRLIAVLVIIAAGAYGYLRLIAPEVGEVPAIPAPAESSSVMPQRDTLVIEVAGSTTGTIEIQLLNEIAPGHVARIIQLAADGAYDGVIFHRVIGGFMAQTGDVQFGKVDGGQTGRAGTGGSDMPNLKAEFSKLPFVKGAVGMARSQSPDSANSQFFIMFDSAPHLNGQYTIVGKVSAGLDVVDAIKQGNPDQNGLVFQPDYMKTVRLKTGG